MRQHTWHSPLLIIPFSNSWRKSISKLHFLQLDVMNLLSWGSDLFLMYHISHSNIATSQWTEMSRSSWYESFAWASKYFISWNNKRQGHLKSLWIFLFSSLTWISIISSSSSILRWSILWEWSHEGGFLTSSVSVLPYNWLPNFGGELLVFWPTNDCWLG